MEYKVSTSSRLEEDLAIALKYYFDRDREIAKRFLLEVEAVHRFIASNPEKIQIKYGNIRVAYLKRFPYGIHFILNKQDLTVLALFHTSQEFEKWKDLLT